VFLFISFASIGISRECYYDFFFFFLTSKKILLKKRKAPLSTHVVYTGTTQIAYKKSSQKKPTRTHNTRSSHKTQNTVKAPIKHPNQLWNYPNPTNPPNPPKTPNNPPKKQQINPKPELEEGGKEHTQNTKKKPEIQGKKKTAETVARGITWPA
jgi:hypothetical protein